MASALLARQSGRAMRSDFILDEIDASSLRLIRSRRRSGGPSAESA